MTDPNLQIQSPNQLLTTHPGTRNWFRLHPVQVVWGKASVCLKSAWKHPVSSCPHLCPQGPSLPETQGRGPPLPMVTRAPEHYMSRVSECQQEMCAIGQICTAQLLLNIFNSQPCQKIIH